jgi:hypothetical protein
MGIFPELHLGTHRFDAGILGTDHELHNGSAIGIVRSRYVTLARLQRPSGYVIDPIDLLAVICEQLFEIFYNCFVDSRAHLFNAVIVPETAPVRLVIIDLQNIGFHDETEPLCFARSPIKIFAFGVETIP